MVFSINGPIVKARGENFSMAEMVKVNGLSGEVISVKSGEATIQIYENTAGLKIGMEVEKSGVPMSIVLRPGLVGGMFDGVMRPLKTGDLSKKFPTKILAKEGQFLREGEIFAEVCETEAITYRATVRAGISGEVIHAAPDGEYLSTDEIIKIKTPEGVKALSLEQVWAIRIPRPYSRKFAPAVPLITGVRVIDSLFPLAKGGTCAIPGGFGTGKTMTQHQIAKFCDADMIIYIGCGERGNEMTEVLESFDASLLSRTILIANTSDMPVAAREAGIYSGITLAECYRDMGYHVAVMADSTSRWAEALRELSGRLEEIPAEEGYPPYLAARLAAFYARAGHVETLGGASGSVTIIGAVSPHGGDFSEPVTLQTKRFVRCFWALDRSLAYARQFPAINPISSYSEYAHALNDWFSREIHENFPKCREEILKILREENILAETVKLVGEASLSPAQREILATAKKIREAFTAQNAYDPTDRYTPPKKQFKMMLEVLLTSRHNR